MGQEGFLIFMVSAMLISLSGVMAPGPMTAATLKGAGRSPLSGLYISIGHGLAEVPLIALIYLGTSRFFESPATRITVGLLGGIYLLYLGGGLLRTPSAHAEKSAAHKSASSFVAGAVLSAMNPYFLLWWATVALGLVIVAGKFGHIGLAVFIMAHWLCDLVWFTLLGAMANRGVKALGDSLARSMNLACGAVMLGFGGIFIFGSLRLMSGA